MLSNDNIIENLNNKMRNLKNEKSAGNLSQLDLSTATISEYKDTDVKAITVSGSNGLSYVTYAKDDKLWEGGMFIKITEDGNKRTASYYTTELSDIGSVTVENGIIIDAKGSYANLADGRTTGWWSEWGNCVGTAFNTMTNGSVAGSVVGVGCVIFGPECGAGVAVGCCGSNIY
jgi:hypothetical protein